MKLSIIMPFLNEAATLHEIVSKVLNLEVDLELIAVDDGSTDAGHEIVEKIALKDDRLRLLRHDKNHGKGAAIRTAIPHCTGDIITFQDADLETNPSNLISLIQPIINGKASVVYGSRVLGYKGKTNTLFYLGGQLVTSFANLLYGLKLTDEPTCYKVFEADLLKSIDLKCTGFEFCPEVTAKIAKRGINIVELPMDYYPRTKADGKKLSYKDGLIAVWTLLKYRFVK